MTLLIFRFAIGRKTEIITIPTKHEFLDQMKWIWEYFQEGKIDEVSVRRKKEL